MYIAIVGFARPDAPDEHKWKRIGAIWLVPEGASLHLRGMRFGEFTAKLLPSRAATYLEGDLVSPYIDGKGKTAKLWCGRIYTAQNHTDATLYYGTIDVLPVGDKAMPMVIEIELDDAKGRG